MPRKKRAQEPPMQGGIGTPSQEDEGDIVSEVGAERSPEGDLFASEDDIRALGAVDAESARENRRLDDIVGKKRANMKNVLFNTSDILALYETVLKVWPANTLDISVKRLTGAPVQNVITSRPRSGVELYEAIKLFHGQHPEAEYEVKILDTTHKQFRGTGRIVMPDTRPQGQQGQPMQHYQHGAPPPPPAGYPPQYAPPQQGYPPQYPPAQAAPPAPAPAPAIPQALPAQQAPDMASMVNVFQQMLEMVQGVQRSAQPPPAPAPVAQPQPQMPPPPAAGADPAAMFNWMKQLFEMAVRTQQQAAPAPGVAAPAPMQQPEVPPITPPRGTVHVPGFGYLSIEQLSRVVNGEPAEGHRGYRPPPRGYRGEPPQYEGQPPPYEQQRHDPRQAHYDPRQPRGYGPQGYVPPGGYAPPQPQQQAPKTPAEQIREALSFVRSAADAMSEMQSVLPGGHVQEAPLEEEESPVRAIDVSGIKTLINTEDGSTRWLESLMTNGFKLAGDLMEKVQQQKQQEAQRQQQQRPRQQLPPNYVEVTEGYVPPPGYVAIPVQEGDLPPAPEHIPPEIRQYRPPIIEE